MPNPDLNNQIKELIPLLIKVHRDLDQDLDLEELASRFGYSPFHFHRKFKEAMGETPRDYVNRLRLEKAAYKLLITNDSIFDISLSVGFKNHETFSRAFRSKFNCSPSSYRDSGRQAQTKRMRENRRIENDKCVLGRVRFESLRKMQLISIRNVGDYYDVPDAFSDQDHLWKQLIHWAESHSISYQRIPIGIFYDNPLVTPPSVQRCDACIPVSHQVAGTQKIQPLEFAGGHHAIIEHTGPDSTLIKGFQHLADNIRRSDEYETRDGPALEIYHEEPVGADRTIKRTDLLLPVTKLKDS